MYARLRVAFACRSRCPLLRPCPRARAPHARTALTHPPAPSQTARFLVFTGPGAARGRVHEQFAEMSKVIEEQVTHISALEDQLRAEDEELRRKDVAYNALYNTVQQLRRQAAPPSAVALVATPAPPSALVASPAPSAFTSVLCVKHMGQHDAVPQYGAATSASKAIKIELELQDMNGALLTPPLNFQVQATLHIEGSLTPLRADHVNWTQRGKYPPRQSEKLFHLGVGNEFNVFHMPGSTLSLNAFINVYSSEVQNRNLMLRFAPANGDATVMPAESPSTHSMSRTPNTRIAYKRSREDDRGRADGGRGGGRRARSRRQCRRTRPWSRRRRRRRASPTTRRGPRRGVGRGAGRRARGDGAAALPAHVEAAEAMTDAAAASAFL